MDPDANLEEQRRLISRFEAAGDDCSNVSQVDAQRLAELVKALDDWICNGGSLPTAWQRFQHRRKFT